jgi:hypothetical protein
LEEVIPHDDSVLLEGIDIFLKRLASSKCKRKWTYKIKIQPWDNAETLMNYHLK